MPSNRVPSNNRGGLRPGAGRPPRMNALQRVTLTLSVDDIGTLKAMSPNLSEAVRQLIAQSRSKSEPAAESDEG
jgi:hypothetical protein